MSAARSDTVIDRLADKYRDMGADRFASYAFLLLGLLAYQSPEVVEFVLDRADEKVAQGGVA